MFGSNNLSGWLTGSTKSRDLIETHRAWDETQSLWRASLFARSDPSDIAMGLMEQSVRQAERTPSVSIVTSVCNAIEALVRVESIGDIEPLWELIETNVSVAVEFRQVLAHRKRWVVDYARMYDAFNRAILEGIGAFYRALPESCFAGDDTAEPANSFEVPLVDLLDDPAAVIDGLFALPYIGEGFRLGLFDKLRELCRKNLLVASGFAPDANPDTIAHRLVRAPAQRNKTGAELAQMYLGGSPLMELIDRTVPFYIPDECRFEHCHIVGGTGHGKTQLMQKMIHADLLAAQQDGRSVVVIDSQGDLIGKLQRLALFDPSAPDSLADRLVLVDPADVEYPAALNLFDSHLDRVRQYGPADRERVLNGVVELYELFFGAFLGAELTQKQGVIFKYLARLMLAIPDATIHTLMRIMEDGRPFKPYMEQLDGSARYFFETEFFHPAFAATKKQVLRRLWGVLSTPAFERMFTQPTSKIDLFEAMNEGKIILISTAKDLLKREGSQLLGRFFIAMIAQAALERSTLPERLRNPTFIYVDEAQEYFDDSIETILAQARKYRVGITLAHQTLDQLSPRLRSAILANTSVKCAGGVSAKDARALADELHTTPEFIDGMKRRGPRSEFALWVKHLTGQAIRLSVPLGFLERQPTLDEEEFEVLLVENRGRYCGAVVDSHVLPPTSKREADMPSADATTDAQSENEPPTPPVPRNVTPVVRLPLMREPSPAPVAPTQSVVSDDAVCPPVMTQKMSLSAFGKGGPRHRHLQALVKELAEQSGIRATIEAPLPESGGQVDVLLERSGETVAVEISVTTPVEHECENLRKCLAAGYSRVVIVLAKSRRTLAHYRDVLLNAIDSADHDRVMFLTPEELPDYIVALAPPPDESTAIVKGYKVRVTQTVGTPEATKARQDAVIRVIARSLK